jgi:branched-chain amino acid transport system ATP-binding protein
VGVILKVDHLTRQFAGLAALKDVSFEVGEAQIYGVIGPNGAGKTTLFRIISGSLEPSAGRIFFRGCDLTGMKAYQAVRAGIARTHQVARPFRSLSALENVEVSIRFGARRGVSDVAREAERFLELVGLARVAGAPACTLSVGDQRRLELARALAAGPVLLLCDEVCSGLTEAEMQTMLDLLRRIRALGTTILYVEHNLRAIMSVCDRVLVLNFGHKLAEGTPLAMQNDPAVVEAYIGLCPLET